MSELTGNPNKKHQKIEENESMFGIMKYNRAMFFIIPFIILQMATIFAVFIMIPGIRQAYDKASVFAHIGLWVIWLMFNQQVIKAMVASTQAERRMALLGAFAFLVSPYAVLRVAFLSH